MYHSTEPKYICTPAPFAIDVGRAHVAAWRQYRFIKAMSAMQGTRWWEG
jgi:hypothetical protein